MVASELQKKAAYFIVFAAILILILILFPFLEDWIRADLAARFGLIVARDGTATLANGNMPDKMTETTVSLVVNILRLVKIFISMALVISFVRFIGYLVVKTAYRNTVQSEISSLLKSVISIIIYIVSFFIIFQSEFTNVQLAPLFTGSTIIGIVVGLALQDTLGNLFAGLALQADAPFQVGDVIAITNRGSGVVESVSWRGVKIRTFQNKLLVISNAVLGKETIEVAPKNNLNARVVFFNSHYSASPAHTIQVVRDAIRQVENVTQKMRPVVRIRNLGESAVEWEVKYWLDDYTRHNDTDALIRQRIWYVFQREKIPFAFPTRTIHIEQKPEEVAPEEVVNTITDHLNRVSIFEPLSDEEIERLANASSSRVYAPGEAIVRMGQEGNSMCVIIRGSVKVQIPEKTYQKTINTLNENDFFGEMSLLSGEPRTATVIAVKETEVLKIDKKALKPIFESNPTLVESVYELIEERRQMLTTIAEAADEEQDEAEKGVMTSIRKFFGLRKPRG